MTPAERQYELAKQRLRIARSRLLLQITSNGRNADRLTDVLIFARQIGDESVADSVVAFRAAQTENLRAAQQELDRLAG